MSKIDTPKIFKHLLKEINFEAIKGNNELFVHPNIPSSLAKNVKKAYSIPSGESILMFRDMGVAANRPAGTVITDAAIYYENYSQGQPMSRHTWDEFMSVALDPSSATFVLIRKDDVKVCYNLMAFCPIPQYLDAFGYAIMPYVCRILIAVANADPRDWSTDKFIQNITPLEGQAVTNTAAWMNQMAAAQQQMQQQQYQQQMMQQQQYQQQMQQQQYQQQMMQQQQYQQQMMQQQQMQQQQSQQPQKQKSGIKWGKWAAGILAGSAAIAGVVAATTMKKDKKPETRTSYPPGTVLPNNEVVGKDGLLPCPQCKGTPMNPPCTLCQGKKRIVPELYLQYMKWLAQTYGLPPIPGI